MVRNFICTSDNPVVKTKEGKLRGYIYDETYTFHGIKYAEADRYMPPRRISPWEGVKDAVNYGEVAPGSNPAIGHDIICPHMFWPESEDCLFLNIWTRSVDPSAKKPVMFWIHGGGFSAGSSIEQVAYDGANLCKYGDVVVVSINHRLNFLGYLDLSPFGEKYRNSGNCGQADIVTALEWVRDNIANFGGDPGNVTIFGQSGGGAKCTALLQTPSADGLFHKSIMMSGTGGRRPKRERKDREIVEKAIEKLGFGLGEIEKIETVELDALTRAIKAALTETGVMRGNMMPFGPTPNDWYVGDPYEVGFTPHARTIPIMVGSVFAEFSRAAPIPKKDDLTSEERRKFIVDTLGDEYTDKLIELFRQAYPGKNEIYLRDMSNRLGTLEYCTEKASQSSAPTYNYVFSLIFPIYDGIASWHCADIPFVFHNTDKVLYCNVPGISERLEDQVCSSFVSFARSGNPNNKHIPEWREFKPGMEATMIFDAETRAGIDFDKALMDVHKNVMPSFPF